MKKLLLVFMALVLSFTLVGCGGDDDSDDVVLNWNIGADPRTLDPGLNGASDGGDVINNTFEGLVREKNGEVFPGMSTDWTVSTDGLTVTFNMREDAKWSDGTDLDATDFVRSWLRAMDPRNVSEYAWIWYYTNVEGAADFADATRMYDEAAYEAMQDAQDLDEDAPDPVKVYTETEAAFETRLDTLKAAVQIQSLESGTKLEVSLEKPTDWFISLMSFYHFMPVPVNANSEGEGSWAKNSETSISNGPFTLSEYTVGDSLVLVKNENYWNAENVGIDVINGLFIDNSTTAYAKYYAGELDFIPSVPTTEIPAFMISNPEFHVFPLLGTYYVNFNLSGCTDLGGTRDIGSRDNDIFCNENLRQALALSLDREAISEALAAGQVPAAGFIPPGFSDDEGNDFYDTSKNDSDIVVDDGAYAMAVTKFAAAAAELGMTVAELQTALNAKEYAHNTSDGHQLVAELMQAMWLENLGFTIQITNEPWSQFQVSRTAGDFDMARGGWLTDFMDPSGMIGIFTPGNSYNDPDYLNPVFVTQITAAADATTSAAHFDALYLAHATFMEDMPVIPVYHYNDSMLVKAYVEGWSRSVLGGVDFSTATIVEAE